MCAILALVPLSLPVARAVTNPGRMQLSYDAYPVGALEWLRENREGGDVLVGFAQGSYALWRLHPRFLVSMDGRYEEVYPQETVDLVSAALDPAAAGHDEAFEAVRPDFIIVRTEGRSGAEFGADWVTVYKDGRFELFEDSGVRGVTPDPPSSAPHAVRPIWEPLF